VPEIVIMDLDLQDKVAVVTGGSKGIGPATARTLREEGVRVVVACAVRAANPLMQERGGGATVSVSTDNSGSRRPP
jgi:NAD(P)-dependent dehydrogenase (short-subunit alcohol dehydrogenase family)